MKSECAACGRVFSGLFLFDKHQDFGLHYQSPLRCLNPEDLGMVQAPNGTWTTPAGLKNTARVAGMTKSRRKVSVEHGNG